MDTLRAQSTSFSLAGRRHTAFGAAIQRQPAGGLKKWLRAQDRKLPVSGSIACFMATKKGSFFFFFLF
jgi:hypothetical protein